MPTPLRCEECRPPEASPRPSLLLRVAAALAKVLPLQLLCMVLGCAALQTPPAPRLEPGPTACSAWKAAELAWILADTYAREQLSAGRGVACSAPPLPSSDVPAEVPPELPTAPPGQVPLPGLLKRE